VGGQPAHRARRDPKPELVELARDPLVAPAGILARQPQHEFARGGVDRRAPRPRPRVGPSPPDEPSVPAQQRPRRDEQAMTARRRQQPSCAGKQRPDTRSQRRAPDLTTQNVHSMAQHEQLKVLDLDAPATAKQQPQQRHEDQIDKRQDHRTILSAPATPELPRRSGFWHPSRQREAGSLQLAARAPRRLAGVPRHDRPDHPAGPPGSPMRSIAPDARALPASTSTRRNFSDEDPR
jgi:hypothetical protein